MSTKTDALGLRKHLTTQELADTLRVTRATVAKRLCQTGSYHGLIPVKLPNRRLLWPADAVQRLLKGESNGAQQ